MRPLIDISWEVVPCPPQGLSWSGSRSSGRSQTHCDDPFCAAAEGTAGAGCRLRQRYGRGKRCRSHRISAARAPEVRNRSCGAEPVTRHQGGPISEARLPSRLHTLATQNIERWLLRDGICVFIVCEQLAGLLRRQIRTKSCSEFFTHSSL